MKVAWKCLALVALSMGGCTAAPPRTAGVPPRPAPSAVWAEHEIPGTGVFARFPATPGEGADWTKSDPPFLDRYLGLEAGSQAYSLSEVTVGSRAGNDAILTAATSFLRNVRQREDVRLGIFRGVEVLGESANRKPTLLRTFVVGGSLVTVSVSATSGALELSSARRFVDSVRLDVPWRVEPIATLGVSVALPAKVFSVDVRDESARMFVLGGVDALYYYISVTPIAPALQNTPDEALTRLVQSYGERGEVTFNSPLELEGARGREVLGKVGTEYLRIRVYIHGDRLYQAMVSSTAKERRTTDDVKRFLDSLRWFE